MLRRIKSIKNGGDPTLIVGMTYTVYAMAVEDPLEGNLQRQARKRVSWEGFLTWSLGVRDNLRPIITFKNTISASQVCAAGAFHLVKYKVTSIQTRSYSPFIYGRKLACWQVRVILPALGQPLYQAEVGN